MDLGPRSTPEGLSLTAYCMGVAEDPPSYDASDEATAPPDGLPRDSLGNRPESLSRLRLAAELLKGLDETHADRDECSRALRKRIADGAGRPELVDEPVGLRRRLKQLARAADRDLAEQLELLVRFDEQALYKCDGCRDMLLWMDVYLRIGRTMSAERLRVGRALRELPVLASLFALGRISFSQLRIITRYATPATDAELAAATVELSVTETAEYCERFRHGRDAEEDLDTASRDGEDTAEARAALRAHERRHLSIRRVGAHATRITLELPNETARDFLGALEQAQDELREGGGEGATDVATEVATEATVAAPSTARQRRADAAVLLGRRSLAHAGEAISMADRYRVHVHVDARLLADGHADVPGLDPAERPMIAGTSPGAGPLSRATARRLAEAAGFTLVATDGEGEPVGWRRVKAAPFTRRQRALLDARDRRCQVPGCGATRHLDGHHVTHREDGGQSDLDNAALVCGGCHRLLHEGGFRLQRCKPGEPQPGYHARQITSSLDTPARTRVRAQLAKVRRFRLFDGEGRELGSIGAASGGVPVDVDSESDATMRRATQGAASTRVDADAA